ncbi:50S ribosomal protein L11 methyltransferase [Anaerosphaera multitolerans]|uniref:Ribosomal protein L11 methyltransferase n=1 Tax=Anaerosphaera multitolerans TaxID=2487351 RepID=A0A437S8B6_9FIRM|nr:50S ribosomal protein L11 methyltransferase [Anaerosphaera multitolerans]RVU55335.1 50S ribosomal protein L11 methyltransferase [Anaerosphaera multitolerans]
MKYIELVVNTFDSMREEVVDVLYECEVYTFEESTAKTFEELSQDEKNWDFVGEEVFSLKKGILIIKCYFSKDEVEIVKKIKTKLEEKNIDVTISETDDSDWANNWKQYYHPVEIGSKITIKPTWENYENKNRIVVEIDPGMAFGTGTHETTSLCIEALEKYLKPLDIVFDIGCGSGILGIAALKLGAEKVTAVDIDPKAIEATKNNAYLNNVLDKMTIYKGNLLDVVEGKADVIVSNIIAEIISDMILDLKSSLNNRGIFISSGIIIEKINLVKDALLSSGFEVLEVKEENGWASIVGRVK